MWLRHPASTTPARANNDLLLRSSKAITKEMMQMTSCFGRPSPDPRLGSVVELHCGHSRRLFNLIGGGKTLACKRIAVQEAPPALLQVEPSLPPWE